MVYSLPDSSQTRELLVWESDLEVNVIFNLQRTCYRSHLEILPEELSVFKRES